MTNFFLYEFPYLLRYEAKEEGFCPGGATLHSMMTPHGPDARCFEDWTEKTLGPIKVMLATSKLRLNNLLAGCRGHPGLHV